MARPQISFRDQMKGFPYGQIIVVCFARISEPIAFSSLFPYVYFLTRDFHVAKTEAEISTYSGYLSAVFSLAQVISALQWSKFSQKRGRKLPIMIGLFGSVISSLTLGFAVSYSQALLARFLMGLLNGNLPLLRTLLGELVQKKEQQPLAFSTFPLLWNVGCIIGPLLSSSLVHPKEDDDFYSANEAARVDFLTRIFPWLQPLNDKFPYALANIVVSILLLLSVVVIFLFLEETHYSVKYQYDFGLDLGDRLLAVFGVKAPERLWKKGVPVTVVEHEDEDPFDYDDEDNDSDSLSDLSEETSLLRNSAGHDNSVGPFTRRQSISLVKTLTNNTTEIPALDEDDTKIPWNALKQPMCYAPILATIILNFHDICYSQFVPVFLSNDVVLNSNGYLDAKFPFRISGGFGYSTEQVGKILSLTGVAGMLVIVFFYPWVDRHFPSTKSYTYSHYVLIVTLFVFPYAIFALPQNFERIDPHEPKDYFYTNIALYTLSFLRIFCASMMYPLVQYLTHAGSPPRHRAFVNSLAITGGAVAKCFAPLIGGFLMTFSIKYHVGYLFFWLMSACALGGYFQSFQLVEDAEEMEDME